MRKILLVLAVTLLSLSARAGDGGAPARKVPDGAKASITCAQLRNLCSGLCHSDTTCFSQCMAGHGC